MTDEECQECSAHFTPVLGEVGVCDACFDKLEHEGYSLSELFDRYPPFESDDDDQEEDEEDE